MASPALRGHRPLVILLQYPGIPGGAPKPGDRLDRCLPGVNPCRAARGRGPGVAQVAQRDCEGTAGWVTGGIGRRLRQGEGQRGPAPRTAAAALRRARWPPRHRAWSAAELLGARPGSTGRSTPGTRTAAAAGIGVLISWPAVLAALALIGHLVVAAAAARRAAGWRRSGRRRGNRWFWGRGGTRGEDGRPEGARVRAWRGPSRPGS